MPSQSLDKTITDSNELTWKNLLTDEKRKPYFLKILNFLKQEEQRGKIIYPKKSDIFNAIRYTPFLDVKVVIIGQDPYHNSAELARKDETRSANKQVTRIDTLVEINHFSHELSQAHGLSFSVQPGVRPPPSLINIFKELHDDCGISIPTHGYLEKWTTQGVLLLNAILTVEKNKPQSHANIGWQQFTDTVIKKLNQHSDPVVFLLWGRHAKQKATLVDQEKHFILEAAHPSPFSAHRGFFGCKHFSKANALLKKTGRKPIDWAL